MAYETHNDADSSAEPLVTEAPDESSAAAPTNAPSAKELAALEKVRHHMAWSAAGGLVPVPGLDLVAVLAAQLKMLKEVGEIYGVPFKQEIAKHLTGSLVGSVGTVATAQATGWVIKSIPFVGMIASAVWQPAIASATTWALGKVFIQHFESGGTFLDFKPETVREHFRAHYEAARSGNADKPEPLSAAAA